MAGRGGRTAGSILICFRYVLSCCPSGIGRYLEQLLLLEPPPLPPPTREQKDPAYMAKAIQSRDLGTWRAGETKPLKDC